MCHKNIKKYGNTINIYTLIKWITDEMDTFLETYNLLRLNNEEIENLNRTLISKKIESIVKTL